MRGDVRKQILADAGRTHLSRRGWRHSGLFLIWDPEKRVMKERRVVVLCTLAVGSMAFSRRRRPMIDGPPRPFGRSVRKFISETEWTMHRGLLEEGPVSMFLCGKIKVKHFISPEWPSRASTPPHLIKSVAPSTQRWHRYIKEHGRPGAMKDARRLALLRSRASVAATYRAELRKCDV